MYVEILVQIYRRRNLQSDDCHIRYHIDQYTYYTVDNLYSGLCMASAVR